MPNLKWCLPYRRQSVYNIQDSFNTVCKFYCNFFHQTLTRTKCYLIVLIMDSSFSQTWVIFLPNRPLGSPKVRSTNEGYWKYFNILGKHHHQHSFNSDINRLYSENPISLWFWTNVADILHFDFWLWGTLEAIILTSHKSFC